MFASPIWSVLLLAAVLAIYFFIIRPRAAFLDVGRDIPEFWPRWLARFKAFRSYVATAIAALLVALPDIIVSITPADLSDLIGEGWAKGVGMALTIYLVLNRAWSTKPPGESA